jgi:hypothetical protein
MEQETEYDPVSEDEICKTREELTEHCRARAAELRRLDDPENWHEGFEYDQVRERLVNARDAALQALQDHQLEHDGAVESQIACIRTKVSRDQNAVAIGRVMDSCHEDLLADDEQVGLKMAAIADIEAALGDALGRLLGCTFKVEIESMKFGGELLPPPWEEQAKVELTIKRTSPTRSAEPTELIQGE